MSLTPVTYLSFDPVADGVGASQVLPYVERLARRGVDITLVSFEHAVAPDVAARLDAAGARWRPLTYGRPGARGGAGRVARAARAVRGAPLVHARSDLAAAAAMLGRCGSLVWDVRSFWADQRIELGMLRAGSPEERVLRRIERAAARRAGAIITLAAAAIPVLVTRHGASIAGRAVVIPTCVDLARYAAAPLPPAPPTRFLLSGSINRYYDMPAMLRLVTRAAERGPVELVALRPDTTPWDDELDAAGAVLARATPSEVPAHVAAAHVGLSVCRNDAGVSLRAATPTKLAEFLATGRPVVVNRGLGDMDEIIAEHRCGVIVGPGEGADPEGVLDELEVLLADPEIATRCRAAAVAHFDVDAGVDRLLLAYERAVQSR